MDSSAKEVKISLDPIQVKQWAIKGGKLGIVGFFTGFLLYWTFKILSPYVLAIVFGFLLSRLFRPFHEWVLHRLFRNRWPQLAAGMSVLLACLIALIPLSLLLGILGLKLLAAGQDILQWVHAGKLHDSLSSPALQKFFDNDLLRPMRDYLEAFSNAAVSSSQTVPDAAGGVAPAVPQANQALQTLGRQVLVYFGQNIFGMLGSMVVFGLNFMLFLVVMFYGFYRGETIVQKVLYLIPMQRHHKEQIVNKIDETVRAVVIGGLLTAMSQMLLGIVGFWVAGVDITWAIVMGVAAFIPVVGTALVWVPVCLFLVLNGHVSEGIGLALYCALVVSMVDNLLRPYFIGKGMKSSENQGMGFYIYLLFAVLGGLTVMGPPGAIFGPIVFGLWKICIEMYKNELHDFLVQQNSAHAHDPASGHHPASSTHPHPHAHTSAEASSSHPEIHGP
jgi:predicted PurR-regulated permease PerM